MLRLFSFLLVITFYSCSPHYSLYEVKSDSNQISGTNLLEYENDSVKITYSFWAENGVMAFSVYNKLNVPLYIDWKKSSMVSNGNKIGYWKDEVRSAGSFNGHLYSGTITENTIYSIAKGKWAFGSIKPERITFLTPHSAIMRVQSRLFPFPKTAVNKPALQKKFIKSNGEKTSAINYNEYNISNTPLSFRNFLSISTTENFINESYIDNAFYVGAIYDVTEKDFFFYKDKKGDLVWSLSDSKWFYVK